MKKIKIDAANRERFLSTDLPENTKTLEYLKKQSESGVRWEENIKPIVGVKAENGEVLILNGNHRKSLSDHNLLPLNAHVLETDAELINFQKQERSAYKFNSIPQAVRVLRARHDDLEDQR